MGTAKLGGAQGESLTRAAFAVMVKFAGLDEAFVDIVSMVEMDDGVMIPDEEGAERDQAIQEIVLEQPKVELLIK